MRAGDRGGLGGIKGAPHGSRVPQELRPTSIRMRCTRPLKGRSSTVTRETMGTMDAERAMTVPMTVQWTAVLPAFCTITVTRIDVVCTTWTSGSATYTLVVKTAVPRVPVASMGSVVAYSIFST